MDLDNVGDSQFKENKNLNNINKKNSDKMKDKEKIPFASIRDQVDTLIRKIVDTELKPVEAYHASKLQSLSSSITSKAVGDLSMISEDFKFVVNCVITSKTDGFGMHSSNSCVWDSTLDGHYLFRWENKSIISIVKVFGLHT
mmetsp:Transcript_7263/g.8768  ORF Transcript_7263/g.8768 Transcript_7263/m.8768 type:complete len:142 (-) Transcript_7263:444-869(-)|eukprot:CAMPEP_0204835080 /NCGR_PEP_ID=MMETSP1346-20131115/21560_1 /ASSEMBLY_ACC=CAM_ASM_000771 /TAXON_ID=215587 /ORGANISM="Aplanochytrium stocchinoi, Strain GSBS06" /LENGTH=141 /DNA_ID=CAMNT_0051968783 /DNA_START=79 /DNA_END=504 /DNA_ORIENTATION=-